MIIKSTFSKQITGNLWNLDEMKRFLNHLEVPKNIFSAEYCAMRKFECELINHIQVLELIEKYDQGIIKRKYETYYNRLRDDEMKTKIFLEFDNECIKENFDKELKKVTVKRTEKKKKRKDKWKKPAK